MPHTRSDIVHYTASPSAVKSWPQDLDQAQSPTPAQIRGVPLTPMDFLAWIGSHLLKVQPFGLVTFPSPSPDL